MGGAKTISLLLDEGIFFLREKQLEAPRLEAELLLCAALSLRRIDLVLRKDDDVLPENVETFVGYLKRRAQREPLQYITGEVEFYGLRFFSRQGVFIPRPETELMAEEARRIIPSPRRILDLCTGSGALAVALAVCFPSAEVTAIDCCEKAIALARLNAERHQCASRLTFLQGDLFEPLESDRLLKNLCHSRARFDLIVCNPPYVPKEDRPYLQPEVRDYEPAVALFSKRGAFYRRILRTGPAYLSEKGLMLLELGDGQAAWFKEFVEKETVFEASTIPDFSGIERVAILRKHKGSALG